MFIFFLTEQKKVDLYMRTMVLVCCFYLIRGLRGSDSLALCITRNVTGSWWGKIGLPIQVQLCLFLHSLCPAVCPFEYPICCIDRTKLRWHWTQEKHTHADPNTGYIQTLFTYKKIALRAAGICCLAFDHPGIV